MPTLFLIRHAETELQGVFLGQLDPALSVAGLHYATNHLSKLEVAVAYTSPLQRARQTASFLRAHRIIELPALREIDYGLWTGQTWSDIQAHWSECAERKCSDWLGVTPPGGEAWPDFVARIRTAWQLIRTGPTPAAIVAHQGVNAAFANLINGQNPLEFMQHHGEVIRVDHD